MSDEELAAVAGQLLDEFGEWPGGRGWWAAAGYPDPPRELVEAVKWEQARRRWAAHPAPAPGAAYFHFTFREPADGTGEGSV